LNEKFASIDIDTVSEIAKRLYEDHEESESLAIKNRMMQSFSAIIRRNADDKITITEKVQETKP